MYRLPDEPAARLRAQEREIVIVVSAILVAALLIATGLGYL